MTRLWNDPADFVDEMIDGFVAANERFVQRTRGGVIRTTVSPEGQVAVVIGGGSGHYPAFAGLVGPGLAHGAAVGNIFASPSAQQIYAVATAADTGGGVLFSYGNYAGDVLNFDAAQARLRGEGIACESVVVTDDIASAKSAERQKRRGIAGDLVVFRIAAAAAESGADLAEVARLARLANERTRSFGVAFSGCVLPGFSEPLFTVPQGRMAVGLGIHGEPGVRETATPTANDLADQLVAGLLAELPEGIASEHGARVVPILNGLGSLKYEEMFVVYRRIAEVLTDAAVHILDPHVGEYCTSLDMAGASLTLFWPDEELERLWDTPVDTPAYRRGSVVAPQQLLTPNPTPELDQPIPPSDDASRATAATIRDLMRAIVTTIDAHADELGRLDAIAGDGDHGIGMQRGSHAAFAAATDSVTAGAGAGTTLSRASDAWSDTAGGTSGALWGVLLSSIAARLGDEGSPDAMSIASSIATAVQDVMAAGKAAIGDKTMIDALLPFSTALSHGIDDGSGLGEAWCRAADVATQAANATADLLPRMGRARTHGQNSVGTPDPGAQSLAIIVTVVGERLTDRKGQTHA